MITILLATCHACARASLRPSNPLLSFSASICRHRLQGQRNMATVKDSVPHVVRTAHDQRQQGLYSATIGRIEQVNSGIRLFRLYLDPEQVGPHS